METYELVCYALAPELSPEEAHARARTVLPDAPRPAPGIRLGILPLAAARHAQRELTAAGVVCNYRPATPERHLSLAESRHTHRCPRCGATCDIPQGRRNYRCPDCRHPILRHGREIPAPTATSQTPPLPEPRPASRSVATLLTVTVMLIGAGTVQPHPLAEQGRDAWNRAVAPLAREFRFLTQAMALARQRSHGTAAAPSFPPTAGLPAPPPAETIGTGTPAPASVSPPAVSPPVSGGGPRPETSPPLPRLPDTVRRSRSLGELQTALTAEIENAPRPAAFPETPSLPAQAAPPVPPPLDIPTERIAAAVATLDAHLARKAPFLRRLYAHDLEQLAQLRRLPGMAAAGGSPGHPPSERPVAHTDTAPTPLPAIPAEPFGFCPIWRRPAPLCPA